MERVAHVAARFDCGETNMTSTLREAAESRFEALTRREESAMSNVEAERLATREKTTRLKALRLAQDAETVAGNVARLKRRRLAATS